MQIPRPKNLRLPTLALALQAAALTVRPGALSGDAARSVVTGAPVLFQGTDVPPMLTMLAMVQRAVLGGAPWALHAAPALAGALLVWLACDTARRMGGTPAAQTLAGLCVVANPVFLRAAAAFEPEVFEQLWWSLGLWALLRRALDDEAWWWLMTGLALGGGLLTAISTGALVLGVLAGAVVAATRRDLRGPWPWLAGALMLAVAVGLPAVIGNASVPRAGVPDWSVTAPWRALSARRLLDVAEWDMAAARFLTGPAVVVACVGLLRLVRDRAGSGTRAVGVACATAFVVLLALHGPSDDATPLLPVLAGAGASQLSQWGETLWQRRSRWLVHGVSILQIAHGAWTLLPAAFRSGFMSGS